MVTFSIAVRLYMHRVEYCGEGTDAQKRVVKDSGKVQATAGTRRKLPPKIDLSILLVWGRDTVKPGVVMIHAAVAESAGVILGDLDSLLAGRVYASIADKLGVPMGYIESYINSGSAAAVLAERLGVNMLAAEDLGAHLGREGRIGLVFGLLLAS